MTARVIHFITTKPKVVLLLAGLLLVASIGSLARLQNDPNPELLPLWHPSRVNLRELREHFTGARDVIAVMVESEQDIFTPASLKRISGLSHELHKLTAIQPKDAETLRRVAASLGGNAATALGAIAAAPAEQTSVDALDAFLEGNPGTLSEDQRQQLVLVRNHARPIVQVQSLADTDNILSGPEGLIVKPIFDEPPATQAEADRIKAEVSGNALFKNLLVGTSGKQTGIFLETNLEVEDSGATYALYEGINKAIAAVPGPERVYVGGTPVTTANIARTIDQDMGRLFPIVLALTLACLWASFRMLRGIVIPVLVVITSIIVTLGIQAAFNVPLNVISSTLPVFLLCIGVADGIHIFTQYRNHSVNGLSREQAVKETLEELIMPVILTSVTTAAGFFSLAFTKIIQIAHFGIFVGLGTMIALGFSLFFIPALLLLLPSPTQKVAKLAEDGGGLVTRAIASLLTRLHQLTLSHPAAILGVSALVVGIATFNATRVKVDNNRVEFFDESSEVLTSANAIMNRLAGAELVNVLVRSKTNGQEPMKTPEVLEAIAGLEEHLRQNPLVGNTTSLAGLVRRMNLVINGNDPSFDRVPKAQETVQGSDGAAHAVSGADLISQYLLLYENGGGDLLSDFVDLNYAQTNVRVDVRSNSSKQVQSVVDDAQHYVDAHFPNTLDVRFAGTGYVLIWAGKEIISGQMMSFAGSVLVVFLVLVVAFRSISKGLVGMVPILAATALNFGLMGALGVALDIGSAIVSSIAIGVGVDYGIHYLARLQEELDKGLSRDEAMAATLRHAGPPIIANAFVVGIGFLALLASSFIPIQTIGWMVALTMFTTCFATLLLMPALIRAVQPRFVRVSAPPPVMAGVETESA